MADPNDPTGPLGRGFEEFKRQSLALASAFNGLTGVFELGIRSLGVAGAEISKALVEVTKVDQRLAVINSDLNSDLGGNTDALEGTTAGLENATRALTELRIAGFQGTNKNLVDLATRLKLSGQNTAVLFSLSQSICSYGYFGLAPNCWMPTDHTDPNGDNGVFQRPLVFGTTHAEETNGIEKVNVQDRQTAIACRSQIR